MERIDRHDDTAEWFTRIRVGPAAPRLSVSMVGQMMFCPRAGLLTFERRRAGLDEEPVETGVPRLDYLPDYDEHLIEQELNKYVDEAVGAIAVQLLLGVVACVVYQVFSTTWGIVLFLPQAPGLMLLWQHLQGIIELRRRLTAFQNAQTGIKISDLGRQEETVNWWSLRKAGFEVTKPKQAYVLEDSQLDGCPFRVLRFQSLRIPVLRKHLGKREIHQSHRASLAGYGLLIERCERMRAPFGILMFHDTYDVLIVPNDQVAQRLFQEGVFLAREVIQHASQGTLPDEPRHNPCLGCPHGRPMVHRPGKTDLHIGKLPGSLNRLWSRRARKWFHSVCGDRFQWLPKHDKAEILELEQR